MGIAIWYFVRSDTEFRSISGARVSGFADGAGLLPTRSDGFVYLVEVIVSVHDRRATAVDRIGYFKHGVLASGRIDRERFFEHAALAVDAAVGGVLSASGSTGVVESGHRFARRRLEHQSRWKPTDADVRDLSVLVNLKAKRKLL